MRAAIGLSIAIWVCVAAWGAAQLCKTHVEFKGLPHRQDWELYKQANSPAAKDCPAGTTAIYVVANDVPFFIECFRSIDNASN